MSRRAIGPGVTSGRYIRVSASVFSATRDPGLLRANPPLLTAPLAGYRGADDALRGQCFLVAITIIKHKSDPISDFPPSQDRNSTASRQSLQVSNTQPRASSDGVQASA